MRSIAGKMQILRPTKRDVSMHNSKTLCKTIFLDNSLIYDKLNINTLLFCLVKLENLAISLQVISPRGLPRNASRHEIANPPYHVRLWRNQTSPFIWLGCCACCKPVDDAGKWQCHHLDRTAPSCQSGAFVQHGCPRRQRPAKGIFFNDAASWRYDCPCAASLWHLFGGGNGNIAPLSWPWDANDWSIGFGNC